MALSTRSTLRWPPPTSTQQRATARDPVAWQQRLRRQTPTSLELPGAEAPGVGGKLERVEKVGTGPTTSFTFTRPTLEGSPRRRRDRRELAGAKLTDADLSYANLTDA